MRQIILDTETTGLSHEQGHRIIEIGCVEMVNRRLTGKNFHEYINPERDIDEGAQAVHGITRDFLENKPVFAQIAEDFMAFVNDSEIIIHNAAFDKGFINAELKRLNSVWKPLQDYCRITDTLALARQMHPGQRNSLDALCKRYSIDNSHREMHGALLDSHLLARVYLAMTGGQATLFGTDAENKATEQATESTLITPKQKRNLCIVNADGAEISEHDQVLAMLVKKGSCLWRSET